MIYIFCHRDDTLQKCVNAELVERAFQHINVVPHKYLRRFGDVSSAIIFAINKTNHHPSLIAGRIRSSNLIYGLRERRGG